ncbi:MAG: hypothetical protein Q7J69_00420 [Candidatus Omnitrophota bacterium]|nr:hypothetical protein [Candidatus Omnitrophota bacterium]
MGLASCGPASYPKARVAEKLVQTCKAEYGLDVKAQLVGTTLGVQVEIPGLMDELRRLSPSTLPEIPPVLIEGKYTQQAFDFRMFTRGTFAKVEKKPSGDDGPREPTEPMKKLQQVSTALMRACLSTDAPIEFYKMIARDPGPDHLDILLSGHILDTKKTYMQAISISELQGRNEFSLRRQPEEMARATVAFFLADLHERPLPQLLSRYTAPSKRFGELLPMVMAVTADLREAKEGGLKPEEWPVRQIARDTVLVILPLSQVGEQGAYLFSVQLQEEAGTLLSIEKMEGFALPEQFRALGPPSEWSKVFYLEPISLPEFVTEQIAKRVMSEYKSTDPEAKPGTKKEPAEKPATLREVTRSLMDAAAYVTDNYSFKDFKEVSAVDGLKGTRWAVPAAELPLYRKRNAPELKPLP